jgi:hypothetical protein
MEYGSDGTFCPSLYIKSVTYPIEPFTNHNVMLIFYSSTLSNERLTSIFSIHIFYIKNN